MTIDTLVFCTMVYDWYLLSCNNNTILAPIIAAQCKDPVIIQQVNNYKSEIDIRIKQILKIEIRPPSQPPDPCIENLNAAGCKPPLPPPPSPIDDDEDTGDTDTGDDGSG